MGDIFRQPIDALAGLLVQNRPNLFPNIPISTSYAWINLEINGNLVVGVADAVLIQDHIMNLIQDIQIIASGSSLRKQMDAETLLKNLLIVTGQYPTVVPPAVGFATSPNAFRMVIPIYFVAVGHASATQTLLNARRLASLSLKITMADVTVVATPGGGGTVAIDPATLTLNAYSREFLKIPATVAYQLNNEEGISPYVAVAPTATLVEIAKLKGSEPINALMFRTEIGGVNSDAVLGPIEIWGAPKGSSRSAPILKTSWADITESMIEEYDLASIFLMNAWVPPAGTLPYTPFDLVGFRRYQIDASRSFNKGEMVNPTDYDPETLVVKAQILAAGTIYITQQSIGAAE